MDCKAIWRLVCPCTSWKFSMYSTGLIFSVQIWDYSVILKQENQQERVLSVCPILSRTLNVKRRKRSPDAPGPYQHYQAEEVLDYVHNVLDDVQFIILLFTYMVNSLEEWTLPRFWLGHAHSSVRDISAAFVTSICHLSAPLWDKRRNTSDFSPIY